MSPICSSTLASTLWSETLWIDLPMVGAPTFLSSDPHPCTTPSTVNTPWTAAPTKGLMVHTRSPQDYCYDCF